MGIYSSSIPKRYDTFIYKSRFAVFKVFKYGDKMGDIKIENVVASATIAKELDLNKISALLEDAEYDPDQFPGLVYRLEKPKTASLLFRSGKIVCTGAKSIDDVKVAIVEVTKTVNKIGISTYEDPDVKVQNIVATTSLDSEINLNSIAISLSLDKVEYEPEQFPGLVYRMDDPKVVMLLFGSGKIVCTGAQNVGDVTIAIKKITEELTQAGLIKK